MQQGSNNSKTAGIGLGLLLLVAGPAAGVSRAAEVAVSLRGKVVDLAGQGIAGARIDLLETSLTTLSGSDGSFHLTGTFQVGLVRQAGLPGGGRLEYSRGRLVLLPAPDRAVQALLIAPDGRSRSFRMAAGPSPAPLDVEAWLGDRTGTWFLRLDQADGSRSFRLVRPARSSRVLLWAGRGYPGSYGGAALRKAGGAALPDSTSLVLGVAEAGHHEKRFHRSRAADTGVVLTLVPRTASRKARLQDFIGAGNTFRIAFLKKDGDPTRRKHVLHYADFAEMAGDTLPLHAFADSRGPETTPFGANVPAWSPDGRALAYEIGAENQTVNNVSRIWIQPLQGPKVEGPAFPATNPRWWTDGKDTSLIWCTSGREDGWKDTASRTFRQRFSGQALAGSPLILAKGSYQGGLSADGAYLATAFRHGVMLETATSARRFFHIYPGHPPAGDGSSTDSLQACNPSISPDPRRPSRMLFLDFGVPPGEPAYPNIVRPQHYAQHQMILIGDYHSEAPGRVVDFVDTPAEELAAGKTWDDPEWSNHPDFAVATTRDPVGDKTNPAEPRPTQPDIYIIHLPTRSALKVISSDNMILPALWVGPVP